MLEKFWVLKIFSNNRVNNIYFFMQKNMVGMSSNHLSPTNDLLTVFPLIYLLALQFFFIPLKDLNAKSLSANQYKNITTNSVGGLRPSSVSGKYLAGRFAHNSQDFGKAANYLSAALSFDQKNLRIRRQAFLSLLVSGRLAEAAVLAKTITPLDQNNSLPILSLLVEEILNGKVIEAEKRLKILPRKGVGRYLGPLVLGWVKFARGDVSGAIKSIEVLDVEPFYSLKQLHIGLIYECAGQFNQAEIAYKKSLKKNYALRGVMAYGVFLERRKRWLEAEELYRRFGEEYGDETIDRMIQRAGTQSLPLNFVKDAQEGIAEVFFNFSDTLFRGQSSELAIIYGRLALRLRPSFPLAQVLLGRLLESLARNAEAVELYKNVDRRSPVSWTARLSHASNLHQLGLKRDAIDLLKKMSKENKNQLEPLIRVGNLYSSQKKFIKAIEAYDKAIKRIALLKKSHWNLYYARGIAFERSKKWSRAEKDFKQALELNPQQPLVLNYLGYSWVDRGVNLKKAQKMIRVAVKLRPNDGYIIDSLGWVLFRLGEYKEATKQLERAVVLRPEDPTINDHLGDAYWQVGRKTEAKFQWNRALSLSPEKELIPSIHKKLREGLQIKSVFEK
ncbi:MAG: hypothetical protein CMM83_07500 [Rhodospirillales bacterium]|nr:hypothetical protein [Rhodospirillales bacterium]